LSKRLAEEEAWKIAKGKSWELVTICPSFVLGPIQGPRSDATSIKTLVDILNGANNEKGVSPARFGIVDVRDVAKAHVLAAQNPKAHGRYMVTSERPIGQLELVDVLRKSGEFNDFVLPTKENGHVDNPNTYSNKRVTEELGLSLIDPAKSVVDMAKSVIQFGLVKRPQ